MSKSLFFIALFIAGEQNSLDERIVDIITSIGSNNSAGPNQSTGLYHEIEILKQSIEQPKNQTKSKLTSMYKTNFNRSAIENKLMQELLKLF